MAGLPIRLRLALGYAVSLLLVLGLVGVLLLTALEENLLRETDEDLRLRGSQIARLIEPASGGLDPAAVAAVITSFAPDDEFAAPGIYVEVLDAQGRAIGASPSLAQSPLPRDQALLAGALAGREGFATLPAGGERARIYALPALGESRVVGVVLVGESLHLLDRTIRRLSDLLALVAAGVFVLALAGSWWLTGRALSPVTAVTRSARRIAATGQFDQRLPNTAVRDELGELTATFNEMIGRLAAIIRRQREFLADASHELRGPLMVIRGNLDLLRLGLPEAERAEAIGEAAEETDRMARLIGDLLFLAEGDAQEVVAHEPVQLDAVLGEVVERAREVDRGAHRLEIPECQPTTVLGDRDRLGQLIWNLVENALRYTPTGGEVAVSLHNYGNVAELSVADRGIGIPAEHLERIFERFYRVDKARSRERGGTGLGLAIVKQIAEAHHGQVRVRSEPGEGSVFTFALPTDHPRTDHSRG